MEQGTLSSRQIEARTMGEQKETVSYLNRHHLLTFTLFVLIIVAAQVWSGFVISVARKLFNVDKLEPWMWLVTAIVMSLVAYVFVRFIVKVPLTSAFSL